MKILIAVLSAALVAFGGSAFATVAQYEVRGVKPNDKLNIRAAPSHKARIVGRIPHNGREIEIIGKGRGLWVRIAHGRTQGFVNRQFLRLSARRADAPSQPEAPVAPAAKPAASAPVPAAAPVPESVAAEPKAPDAPAAGPVPKLPEPDNAPTSLPGSKQDGDDTPALMKPPADLMPERVPEKTPSP
jgi:hypothetical protein